MGTHENLNSVTELSRLALLKTHSMTIMCLVNDSNAMELSQSLEAEKEPNTALPEQERPTGARRAKPNRRVSFGTGGIMERVTNATHMTEQERDELWYPAEELEEMKNRTRDVCRRIRILHADDVSSESEQSVVGVLDIRDEHGGEDTVRGLEHRISFERQKNKFLAIQVVLKAQRRYPADPDRLANIACRCSEWAKDVALQSARRDFAVLYDPSAVSKIPATPSVPFPTFPLRRLDLVTRHHEQLEEPMAPPTKRPRLIPPEIR